MATPAPAARSIGTSLPPSPTAISSSARRPYSRAKDSMPVALSTPRTFMSVKIGHQRFAASEGNSGITRRSVSASR